MTEANVSQFIQNRGFEDYMYKIPEHLAADGK